MVDKKIVFTNGCFDIVHVGHIQMLNEAKEDRNYLVVGLIQTLVLDGLKGETRPVNKELDRKFFFRKP